VVSLLYDIKMYNGFVAMDTQLIKFQHGNETE